MAEYINADEFDIKNINKFYLVKKIGDKGPSSHSIFYIYDHDPATLTHGIKIIKYTFWDETVDFSSIGMFGYESDNQEYIINILKERHYMKEFIKLIFRKRYIV